MSILPVGFGSSGGIDVGDIANSLRFRSSASASLTKTSYNTSATATYFAFIKRGKLGAISPIFDSQIKFNANDTLTAFGLTTTAVFRDPSAFLAIVVGNGELRINGVSYGSVTTSAITGMRIGFDGTNYFDGYMARIGVVDNTASAYTNFGYLNTEINEWVSLSQSAVKAVVDAGGTNSFMLDFDDPNYATYNIGKDLSSKGNHWTPSGFNVSSAGTTYDHMLDVPGTSWTVGNAIIPVSGGTLTDGNLTITTSGTNTVRPLTLTDPTLPVYAECYLTTKGAPAFGVIKLNASAAQNPGVSPSNYWHLYDNGVGLIRCANGSTASVGPAAANTDTWQVAYKPSTGDVWVGRNNSWYDSSLGLTGNPSTGANPTFTGVGNDCAIFFGQGNASGVMTIMPGQAPLHASASYYSDAGGYFRYTPPTGFLALNQANLSDTGTVTVSGTFTGNLNADGPFVWMNGVPTTLTINGNAVTFGTHADKTAGGFKLRTASSSYNNTGSNTWTATIVSDSANLFKWNNAQGNP